MALWDRISSRGKVEDRRGAGPMLIGGGGLGVGGVALLLLLTYLQGGDFSDILATGLQQIQVVEQQNVDPAQFEGADQYETFASAVLGSSNDMWSEIFAQSGQSYDPPTLVLFRGATASECGGAHSQVGPHYCPIDETIYLDETFFDELQRRFGAKGGDVAEAYVIAHEVAHHAQQELGIMDEVQRAPARQQQDLSIKLELQADCFAGLWAYSIKDLGVIEPGEIAEAMDAAAAVGDDRIQETTTGRVNPESWTHGSSEERVAWFTRGYESGQLSSCNTFGT